MTNAERNNDNGRPKIGRGRRSPLRGAGPSLRTVRGGWWWYTRNGETREKKSRRARGLVNNNGATVAFGLSRETARKGNSFRRTSRYAVRATHEVEDRRLSLFGRSIKNASYADGTGRLLYIRRPTRFRVRVIEPGTYILFGCVPLGVVCVWGGGVTLS